VQSAKLGIRQKFDFLFGDFRYNVSEMETLKVLYEYFPTAVYTGRCLVFISEDWRVELTEHKNTDYTQNSPSIPLIRVRIFKKALNGEFVPGHYEDFQLPSMNDLAAQVEKYVQFAIGKNIRENI
jgi:hypothetical protein